MSTRTAPAIDAARADGRAALVAYLPLGFPDVDTSVAAARAVVEAGVDIVELGLPYTDPVLDGPVIQHAAQTALAGGLRVADLFGAVERIAATGAPTLVMTYFNPVMHYGVARFARDLDAAGGAGLITADLIPDEGGEWIEAADAHDLDKVFLVAPSSTSERLALTAAAARGFVYAASTMGVTGTRASVGAGAASLVARTRAAGAERVCVGIGVSTPAHAAEVASYADGVIVGSALVKALGDGGVDGVARLAAELADGVRQAEAGEEVGA
ncbi:tryptophan synthase alpha chain [Salana multivorans]|uniref:Tryptophan synthase alpha chain n=1 Tax=Salana multivorans TaxID=120377 RepID=A0A3N2D0Z8_9MICO|nr:tryptophan synthase subunit alpha [Salana multivorans]MBN8883820.1 tryptophan synthase subunit alpha [Salana multivorans]OJX94247.1 MAG: tryptophan synthase subunit alpha [Micrococcales bacterium 73-15]ROR93437.1 tryptophan synthase alpha chain [Salana multivorans]